MPYGVFVVTPPPSETIVIGHAPTAEKARELAAKWADNEIYWRTLVEGVSPYGEMVYIEEMKLPLRREEPLTAPKWDEIFETGVFERFLGPRLDFQLNKLGEGLAGDWKMDVRCIAKKRNRSL